ncbi:MAG: hypothetical protein EXX96DRAFT_540505 [Benjaminiella poitrasii]|nr:MAG: hypothetical protein EXX96DRAFT_540505 [Benjaminiella poitrasii]
MSKTKEQQPTAHDYIKSYVKDSNTEEYLKQEQPQYDPERPLHPPQTTPIADSNPSTTAASQKSDHYKIHLPTQNPISTTNEHSQEAKHLPSQVVWTSRDIKDQRNEIHDASLTICADLHEDLITCFQHGSWWDKAKMCEEQKQKFWNCFNAQKKFLREVNYKAPITTEKEDERILAEAYKLRDKIDQQQ